MNTIVNHKSKDILQVSWAENPPADWQGVTARKRRDSKCDCLGVVSGASNRGAPRGARAQKQTNLASDARQHGERERFRRSFDEARDATLKSRLCFSCGNGRTEQANKIWRTGASPRSCKFYCLGGSCPRESLMRYCGQRALIFPRKSFGNKSSNLASSTSASTKSSKSGTRRSPFSSRDREP